MALIPYRANEPGFEYTRENEAAFRSEVERTLAQISATLDQLTATVEALATGAGFSLPTSEPSEVGDLWNSAGTVTVSDGP